MLTSHSDLNSVKTAKTLGASYYIVKPPESEDLLKKIKNEIGTDPQFRNYDIPDGDELTKGVIPLKVEVLSVSEMGMSFSSTCAFRVGEVIKTLNTPLFEQLNIINPPLLVCDCQPNNAEKPTSFTVGVSFINLPDGAIAKLREWVVEKCLKS